MALCSTLQAGGIFEAVVGGTDCLVRDQIGRAYAAFGTSAAFTGAVTAALTIYVAIIGYRLVLGLSGISLRAVVPHFVKVGIVLALTASWPTYQTLVFELLFNGPDEIASLVTVGNTNGHAGRGVTLARLQSSYDRITEVATEAWEHPAATPTAAGRPVGDRFALAAPNASPNGIVPASALQLGAPQFLGAILWLTAIVLAMTTVGALLALRIILALLLLVGPIFIVAGLFAVTRGLLEGWVRVAVQYAIAPLFVTLASAGLVLAMNPFIATLEATPGSPDRGAVIGIALVTLVFAAVLMQAAQLSRTIAGSIRLPRGAKDDAPDAASAPSTSLNAQPTLSRAQQIVEAINQAPAYRDWQRIEVVDGGPGPRMLDTGTTTVSQSAVGRLGQSYQRTAVTRPRPSPARNP